MSLVQDTEATGFAPPADRRLIWHGMFLFLIGLVTGLFQQRFRNMRMALSAHLEGVMNGTFLIALGAIWANLQLPPRAERAVRWTALYGAYGNWLFTTLGAAMGTAALSPTLSQGHHGKPWQERLVGVGLVSIALSILAAVGMMLVGLGRPRQRPVNAVTSASAENGEVGRGD